MVLRFASHPWLSKGDRRHPFSNILRGRIGHPVHAIAEQGHVQTLLRQVKRVGNIPKDSTTVIDALFAHPIRSGTNRERRLWTRHC